MITDRQIAILRLIVDDFIREGQPVGSRTISKHPGVNLSPATIRNDMADLEEYGYIIQPHISAGRIPSELGMRYYLDEIFLKDFERDDLNEQVGSLLSGDMNGERILRKASRMLRELSEMTAIVTMPAFKKMTLQNLKLIRIDSTRFLMILVSDNADIRTMELLHDNASQETMDHLSKLLLDKFKSQTIEAMDLKAFSDILGNNELLDRLIIYILPKLREALKEFNQDQLFICGLEHIVDGTNCTTLEEAKAILEFFNDNDKVLQILKPGDEGTQIMLGNELHDERFKRLALIKSDYYYNGDDKGSIALIGSVRMDYRKALNLIEDIRDTVEQIFSGITL
ncbi:heat-inducible transcriptional repressor HrcA [Guggenheimella bovis]